MSVSTTLACYTPYGLRLGYCSMLHFERIILYVGLYQPLQVGPDVQNTQSTCILKYLKMYSCFVHCITVVKKFFPHILQF